MSYDDGRVALTDDEIVIRAYYFPRGAKHIRYADISQVRRKPLTLLSGSWQVWGSNDLRHWYNYDPERPRKSTQLLIKLRGKPTVPVITPDRPQEVTAELASHGIEVTGG